MSRALALHGLLKFDLLKASIARTSTRRQIVSSFHATINRSAVPKTNPQVFSPSSVGIHIWDRVPGLTRIATRATTPAAPEQRRTDEHPALKDVNHEYRFITHEGQALKNVPELLSTTSVHILPVVVSAQSMEVFPILQ